MKASDAPSALAASAAEIDDEQIRAIRDSAGERGDGNLHPGASLVGPVADGVDKNIAIKPAGAGGPESDDGANIRGSVEGVVLPAGSAGAGAGVDGADSEDVGSGDSGSQVAGDEAVTDEDLSPAKSLGTNALSPALASPIDERSLGTNALDGSGDEAVTDEDLSPDDYDLLLNEQKLFEVAACGCHLPKWRGIEWRDQENGHRYLRYVGMGLSVNGKPTKRRKYGKYYTHRGITLFVEGEYADKLKIFQQRAAFNRPKRRSKA